MTINTKHSSSNFL